MAERGYLVYNAGIPATDPKQYAFLAEKYVPLLKPDIVALFFCLSNDFHTPQPMVAYEDPFYVTNAGWLYAFDADGNHMTAQEAYAHYLNLRTNLLYAVAQAQSIKGKAREVFLRTVLGSYSWFGAVRLRDLARCSRDGGLPNPAMPFLEEIKRVSSHSGAGFLLFVIPEHPGAVHGNLACQLRSFDGLDPRIPDCFTIRDYTQLPDGHFNNSGHSKYAEFILRHLESTLSRSEQKGSMAFE